MKDKRAYHFIIDIICFSLILLFVYTALSKLLEYPDFRQQMLNQVFPRWISEILFRALPPVELSVAICLSVPSFRYTGLWASLLLMSAFTVYVGLVLLRVFDRVPCSCGGVLQFLGWKTHFVFNLFFLLLTIIGINIYNRGRRLPGA